MSDYFDRAETQPAQLRQQQLMNKLAEFVQFAQTHSDYYRELFADIDAGSINSREALATLPITRKSDLIELQQQRPPLAGITSSNAVVSRLFQSPGPICEPERCSDDWWGVGRAFYAAGFRQGDLVQNCLSYHMSPGGFILDSGARACGSTVIPAGPGNTDQQLDLIEQLRPNGYCGTPSFLNILLDKANEQGRDVSSISKALVTGEAFTAPLQQRFVDAGIHARQAYATADLGLIGYESQANQGLIVAEDIIVEMVRPGSGELVAPGEVGEVVVTRLNGDYPMIRFATGDLSSQLTGTSSCGRTNIRIAGWQGRADQSTKVKGMFVHPSQIQKIRREFEGIGQLRLQVGSDNNNDTLTLLCEPLENGPMLDASAIEQALRHHLKLSGTVELVAVDSLARDGIVIEDRRTP